MPLGEKSFISQNRTMRAGTYRYATLQNWRTHIDRYIAPSADFINEWCEAQKHEHEQPVDNCPIGPTLGQLKIQD
jgi:hypothetical protein